MTTTSNAGTKKQKAAYRNRIARIYGQRCHGVSIRITSIPEVYAAGEAVMLAGGDDEAVGDALRAAAEKAAVGR